MLSQVMRNVTHVSIVVEAVEKHLRCNFKLGWPTPERLWDVPHNFTA